jgi:hypothetical protein
VLFLLVFHGMCPERLGGTPCASHAHEKGGHLVKHFALPPFRVTRRNTYQNVSPMCGTCCKVGCFWVSPPPPPKNGTPGCPPMSFVQRTPKIYCTMMNFQMNCYVGILILFNNFRDGYPELGTLTSLHPS